MKTEIQIMAKMVLVNGRCATNGNAARIRCESAKVGCNVRCAAIPDPANYRQVYRIRKDHWDEWKDKKKTGRKQKGYSFVEINHGCGGPGGIQRSVRRLIIAAAFGLFGTNDNRIIFEGDEEMEVAA